MSTMFNPMKDPAPPTVVISSAGPAYSGEQAKVWGVGNVQSVGDNVGGRDC